jgi:methoxymalonate biosynthesis acyl carrier protein
MNKEITLKVRQFLEGYVLREDFSDDDDMFALGLVNSLMAMQMVLFLEKEFEVKFNNDELNIANFRSVSSIVNMLEGRKAEV